MIYQDFVKILKENTSLNTSDSKQIIGLIFRGIGESLERGEIVRIKEIGHFTVKERGEHKARNPRTGEAVTVPASKRVVFKSIKTLKDRINRRGVTEDRTVEAEKGISETVREIVAEMGV